MGPVVAPAGTVAVICVGPVTVNVMAAVPLNLTEVAPVRFVPVMVTLVPTAPLVGVNEEMDGGGTTVKLVAEVAVPPGVVTLIGPVDAAAGTVAVICVLLLTVNPTAVTELNLTAVAPLKFVPVMVTLVATGPLVGVKPEMVGVPVTVKLLSELPVPLGEVTLRGPVVAPAGTDVVIWVLLTTVKIAVVPLNWTEVAPVKFMPLMVTAVLATPLVGVKLVMLGPGTTVKAPAEVPVPAGVTTLMGPVMAPPGTVAVIWVALTTMNVVAAVPANRTALVPVKPVPVTVTLVPTGPLVGLKLVTVGGMPTAKLREETPSSGAPAQPTMNNTAKARTSGKRRVMMERLLDKLSRGFALNTRLGGEVDRPGAFS